MKKRHRVGGVRFVRMLPTPVLADRFEGLGRRPLNPPRRRVPLHNNGYGSTIGIDSPSIWEALSTIHDSPTLGSNRDSQRDLRTHWQGAPRTAQSPRFTTRFHAYEMTEPAMTNHPPPARAPGRLAPRISSVGYLSGKKRSELGRMRCSPRKPFDFLYNLSTIPQTDRFPNPNRREYSRGNHWSCLCCRTIIVLFALHLAASTRLHRIAYK